MGACLFAAAATSTSRLFKIHLKRRLVDGNALADGGGLNGWLVRYPHMYNCLLLDAAVIEEE